MAGLFGWDNYLRPPRYRKPLTVSDLAFDNIGAMYLTSGTIGASDTTESVRDEDTSTGITCTPELVNGVYQFGLNPVVWDYACAHSGGKTLPPNLLVIGAHQHIAGAFVGSGILSVSVTIEGNPLASARTLDMSSLSTPEWLAQPSVFLRLPESHVMYSGDSTPPWPFGMAQFFHVVFTCADASPFFLPEIFIGRALEVPAPDWGFDPMLEKWGGSRFTTISGRVAEQTHLKQLNLKPSFSHFPESSASEFNAMREGIIEERRPFWYIPDVDKTHECWHVKANGNISFPRVTAVTRSLSLNLLENV